MFWEAEDCRAGCCFRSLSREFLKDDRPGEPTAAGGGHGQDGAPPAPAAAAESAPEIPPQEGAAEGVGVELEAWRSELVRETALLRRCQARRFSRTFDAIAESSCEGERGQSSVRLNEAARGGGVRVGGSEERTFSSLELAPLRVREPERGVSRDAEGADGVAAGGADGHAAHARGTGGLRRGGTRRWLSGTTPTMPP